MARVAVVHPRQPVRALASHVLAGHGFQPVEAETLADLVALMAADPPDVIIVDERFVPDLPTLQVPWIALGYRRRRASIMGAGAACMIEKPFSDEDLARAVRWVLEVYART